MPGSFLTEYAMISTLQQQKMGLVYHLLLLEGLKITFRTWTVTEASEAWHHMACYTSQETIG